MESLKPKVHAVQVCQSALRIPEEVVTSLPICHTALRLQEEASRLQHTAIQQCNIMQARVTVSHILLWVIWPHKLQWKQFYISIHSSLPSHTISMFLSMFQSFLITYLGGVNIFDDVIGQFTHQTLMVVLSWILKCFL